MKKKNVHFPKYLFAEEIVALRGVRKVSEFLRFGGHLARGAILVLFFQSKILHITHNIDTQFQ